MSRNTLYTYANLEEFNRLYDEVQATGKAVYAFEFQETKELIEGESGNVIDISAMIEFIINNPGNRYSAWVNLQNLDSDNRVVVRENLADIVLEKFSTVFNTKEPLYDKEPIENVLHTISRRAIYTYADAKQLEDLISFVQEKSIPFYTFNQATKHQNPELTTLNRSETTPIVDITSMVKASKSDNNTHIIYFAEQLIELLHNTHFIVHNDFAELALENFPLHFDSQKNIETVYPELKSDPPVTDAESKENELRKITQYKPEEISEFENFFSENLIGHTHFKDKFFRSLRNFIKLNRIKEKKLLSVFLLGQSGIGKTEVARLIAKWLNPNTSLAKINFGNYSSQDALNSLIGSPAGYVGCESGELGIKTAKSKAGIIVCDEFEKTTRPVFNFFLELLEDGSFTDSLTREYDLDGYIIVFTSNIPSADEFYKTIPPELQSRFDLVCEFKSLSETEKKEYVDFQVERYISRLSDEFARYDLTPAVKAKLADVPYKSTDNLRDIKRMVEQNVIEFLEV